MPRFIPKVLVNDRLYSLRSLNVLLKLPLHAAVSQSPLRQAFLLQNNVCLVQ